MSASYFRDSRNLHMGDLTVNHYEARSSRSDRAFDNLHDNIASEAIHNSDERCDAPKCYPETRKAVQEEIVSWITHGDNDDEPKKILWVTGPAGCGKTAIAGSVAEICEDQGILAGSFFFSSFSGSEKRKSKRFLVGTLAYGFFQHDGLQALRGSILSAIERDPAIFRKRLRDQCRALLLKPFHDAQGHLDPSSLPRVIIIDGLDEVEAANSRQLDPREARLANEADQVEILATLLQVAHDADTPFRILIVSRPERAIREFFSHNANHVSRELFLDNKYDPDADITLFLNAKFAEIRRRYGLSASWPSQADIKRLVDQASGQFIYVATVVRFLQDSKLPDPQARLLTVLTLRLERVETNPLAPLDALYTSILTSSPDPLLAVRWLGAIHHYLGDNPALFVKQLLQDFEGQADHLLENLASLVKIPPVDESDESPYGFYHKTLSDFLGSKRCGREFKNAFRDHSAVNLIDKRLAQVFKAKSPKVAPPETQLQFFLRHWFNFLGNYSIYPSDRDDTSTLSLLRTCDVVWWAHAVITTFWAKPGDAAHILVTFFDNMHTNCLSRSGMFNDCLDECKHWRGNILRACRALGWATPNLEATLLYNTLQFISSEGWKEEDRNDGYSDFKPPDTVFANQPPPIEVLPPTIYDGEDKDYKSLCDLVDRAFSCMPDNWRSVYAEELSRRREKALISKLVPYIEQAKRRRELGLDVQDGGDSDGDSDSDSNGDSNSNGDMGQGENPACERQAGSEEHGAGFSEGQDEVDDEDPVTFLAAPSPHYAPTGPNASTRAFAALEPCNTPSPNASPEPSRVAASSLANVPAESNGNSATHNPTRSNLLGPSSALAVPGVRPHSAPSPSTNRISLQSLDFSATPRGNRSQVPLELDRLWRRQWFAREP